jgi:hypothetical protein
MSSATSIDDVRLKAATGAGAEHSPRAPLQKDQSLQPWQFFVLAALGCATAATFLARGQGVTAVILLAVLMASVALVGLAVLRAVRPLVSPHDDRTVMIGRRTRAALEREKMLTLRSIKELEFDRAMGKLSEADFVDMSARLRARASRLIRQLDVGDGYRDQIERDLARRLADAAPATPPATEAPAARLCAACSTANDADARFCKSCGHAF